MGLRNIIKNHLPVSSRSFHSDAEYMKEMLERMMHENAQLQRQLGAMSAELAQSRHEMVDLVINEHRHKKVHYLIGEAGFPNYGDELITREWLKYLAHVDPETPVVLDCMRPGPATALLRPYHPHFQATDTVARMTVENSFVEQAEVHRDIPVQDIANHVTGSLDEEGRAARIAAGIRLIRNNVATMHAIGGGYMNSKWVANLARLAAPLWAQRHGMPSIATGAGLVPLKDEDLHFVREVAQTLEAFTCRDEHSLEAVNNGEDGPAKLAADDCFVNGLEGVYADPAGLPDIMLCIQEDMVEGREPLFEHVRRILEAWNVAPDAEIGVVECIPYECGPLLDTLTQAGYRPRLFPMQIIFEEGFPAREGQRWLSTRYHPHLLAAAKGCEGTYVVVEPGYYDVKHEAVLRMGSRWTQSAVGDTDIPQPGPGFKDPSVRFTYRDEIRKTASVLYPMRP